MCLLAVGQFCNRMAFLLGILNMTVVWNVFHTLQSLFYCFKFCAVICICSQPPPPLPISPEPHFHEAHIVGPIPQQNGFPLLDPEHYSHLECISHSIIVLRCFKILRRNLSPFYLFLPTSPQAHFPGPRVSANLSSNPTFPRPT